MAILAPIFVGGAGELAFVSIDVAVQTNLIFDLIKRGFAGGTMTLVAGHRSMLSPKRVSALRVRRYGKGGWFPAFHIVTAGAFALVRA